MLSTSKEGAKARRQCAVDANAHLDTNPSQDRRDKTAAGKTKGWNEEARMVLRHAKEPALTSSWQLRRPWSS